eukprot:EG_transcript_14511
MPSHRGPRDPPCCPRAMPPKPNPKALDRFVSPGLADTSLPPAPGLAGAARSRGPGSSWSHSRVFGETACSETAGELRQPKGLNSTVLPPGRADSPPMGRPSWVDPASSRYRPEDLWASALSAAPRGLTQLALEPPPVTRVVLEPGRMHGSRVMQAELVPIDFLPSEDPEYDFPYKPPAVRRREFEVECQAQKADIVQRQARRRFDKLTKVLRHRYPLGLSCLDPVDADAEAWEATLREQDRYWTALERHRTRLLTNDVKDPVGGPLLLSYEPGPIGSTNVLFPSKRRVPTPDPNPTGGPHRVGRRPLLPRRDVDIISGAVAPPL